MIKVPGFCHPTKAKYSNYLLNVTSSREMSSLLKVRPGMRPLFFNQKIDAKLPEKKIPSTAANATIRSPNEAVSLAIHCKAQSALRLTHGIVSTALNKKSL